MHDSNAPDGASLLDGFLSLRDAASQLGTSPRTLQRWVAQGKGPPVHHLGKIPWFHIERTKQWVLDQARAPVRPVTTKPRARKRQGRGRP
jgi:hypothetical protein